jgi:hypothetical protein
MLRDLRINCLATGVWAALLERTRQIATVPTARQMKS